MDRALAEAEGQAVFLQWPCTEQDSGKLVFRWSHCLSIRRNWFGGSGVQKLLGSCPFLTPGGSKIQTSKENSGWWLRHLLPLSAGR